MAQLFSRYLWYIPFYGWCYLFLLTNLTGQTNFGLPHIDFIDQKEFAGYNGVWASCQDEQGIMYFGAGHGLFEYDGTDWRQIATPRGNIRQLYYDQYSDRIYVGGLSIMGYLYPDSTGMVQFQKKILKPNWM